MTTNQKWRTKHFVAEFLAVSCAVGMALIPSMKILKIFAPSIIILVVCALMPCLCLDPWCHRFMLFSCLVSYGIDFLEQRWEKDGKGERKLERRETGTCHFTRQSHHLRTLTDAQAKRSPSVMSTDVYRISFIHKFRWFYYRIGCLSCPVRQRTCRIIFGWMCLCLMHAQVVLYNWQWTTERSIEQWILDTKIHSYAHSGGGAKRQTDVMNSC